MNKLLTIALMLIIGFAQAQTVKFAEDFETLPLSVTSSGSSTWARNTNLYASGAYSDSAAITSAGDTTILTTNAISTIGYNFVNLSFNQICKLAFQDAGYIEISNDNGVSWTRLTSEYYNGYGNFEYIGNKFNIASYPTLWDAYNPYSIPQNSWWKLESFSLDTAYANKSQIKIRFIIADGDNNGASNNYGWLLDDIKVTVSNNELTPPNISINNPYPKDTVYYSGLFDVSAEITDSSNISSASIVFEINGIYDTVPMILSNNNIYTGSIPSQPYETSVCYHIIATDSSVNMNIAKYPASNCISFYVKRDPNLPTPLQYDASVHSIASPPSIALSNTNYDISIRIVNNGDSILTKVGIGLELDGISQNDKSWVGSLSLEQISDTIIFTNTTLTKGEHNITAWTYAPNDSSDQDLTNDTLSYSFYVCNEVLHGTYTLGGTSADFLNFEDLILTLRNCGINANTTIKVNPGIYSESIIFSDLVGVDSINRLTIESATGDANDVVIKHGSENDFVIKFDSSAWVSIKNISIESYNNASSSTINITNYSHDINIEGCNIKAPIGGSNNTYAIYAKESFISNINITNNNIFGGKYGLYFKGSSSMKYSNISVINNTIEYSFSTGIYFIYHTNTIIDNNKIIRPYNTTALTYITGIKIMQVHGYSVNNNEININLNSSGYGISIVQCTNNGIGESTISNNMVSVGGTSNSTTANCIYFYGNTDCKIFNNSMLLNTGSGNASAFYLGGSTSTADIRNNIFSNKASGYAFINTVTSIDSVNYNCYYTNGISIAKWGSGVAATSSGIAGIRLNSGKDTHSILTNPTFYSNTDLHSFSQAIDSAAIHIASITHDIDGDIRNVTNPDIGADEFTISDTDIGISSLLNILAVDTQNRVINLKVIVRNYGLNTITALTVKHSLNGGNLVSNSWTGSINYGETDTVDLGNITVPALDYSLNIFTVLTGDTIADNDSINNNFYGLPLIEVEPLSINSPLNGCDKTSNESISIEIANNGVHPIYNGITASYQIVGSSLVSENVSDTILAGDTIIYTFNQTADFSVGYNDSTFNIVISVNHTDDPKNNNDSILSSVLSMGDLLPPTISDTTIFYGTSVDIEAIADNPINWYANDSTTVKLSTGSIYTTPILFDTATYYAQASNFNPSSLASVGFATTTAGSFDEAIYGRLSGAGKYQILYTASELLASGLVAGKIESIEFHVGYTYSSYNITSFDISMANVSETALTTSYLTPNFTNVYSEPLTGPKNIDTWIKHEFSTPFEWDGTSSILIQICTQGSVYNAPKVYYTTTTTNKYLAKQGFGVNCSTTTGNSSGQTKRPNIKLHTIGSYGCTSPKVSATVNVPLPAIDAHLASISQPNNSCGLISTPITIDIVNNGLDTIPNGFTATYKIDNASFINNETIGSSIAPNDTLHYTFTTLASLPSGSNSTLYAITAKIFVPNDNYVGNDSLYVDSVVSDYTPSNPVTSNIGVNYSNTAILSAVAIDSIFWYSDLQGSNYLGAGNNFETDHIYDTTTFFAQSRRSIAQAYYNIGTSSTISDASGPSPYGAANNGSRMQYLITASELNALGIMQGPISSISFNVTTTTNSPLSNYTIRIGHTSKNNLLASTLAGNLTTVYSSSSYMAAIGWNEHQLNTPFFWDGTSNIIIETCFKNSSPTAFSFVKYSTTSFTSVAYLTGGSSFSCSDSIVTGNSTHRPNIRIKQTGLSTCGSELVPLNVNITNTVATDVGISYLVEPNGLINSIDPTNVKIILKNYGYSNISSATIKWTEKGIAQTTYNWTGSLAHNEVDTVTISTNHIFMGGKTELVIWSEMTGDTININDTISEELYISMSGSYSINPISGDYHSFTSALNELSLVGVCGPVVFNADSGVYIERFSVNPINGASTTNTITFQSTLLDSSSVTITNNSLNTTDNYIVKIVGASNIKFKYISFVAIGNTYANVIALNNGTNNIEFSNNIIKSISTTSINGNANPLYSTSNINNITLNNNSIINGAYGIFINSSSNSLNITNNIIKGFNGSGIYLANVNNSIIKENILESQTQGLNINGIKLILVNNIEISKNNIICKSAISNTGIYLRGYGTASNHLLISNNFISIISGSAVNTALYVTLSNYIDVIYNSTSITSGSSSTTAMKINNCTYINVKNNSFSTERGYAMSLVTIPNNSIIDYNNLYVHPGTSSSFVYWTSSVNDLAALKTLDLNNNQHSISNNPEYFSTTDLHAGGIDLYQSGIPYTSISTDIDGDTRNTTSPCIGADEFTPIATDLSLIGLDYPIESSCGYSSNDSIIIKLKNKGYNPFNFNSTNANIELYINGTILDTLYYSVNSGILLGGEDTLIKISSAYDLSITGEYIFNGKASVANDGNSLNDYMQESSIINYPSINNFPYHENFESGKNLSFNEISSNESNISVTSSNSGNSVYELKLEGGGYSGWISPSNVTQAFNNISHTASLESCNIDATNISSLYVKFNLRQTRYSNYVYNSSWFRVILTDANSNSYYLKNIMGDSVFKPISQILDSFKTQTFNLDQYTGQIFRISFESACKYSGINVSSLGDNAFIDDISFWSPSQYDVAVNSTWSNSFYGKPGDIMTISTSFTNVGLDTLFSIPLAYKLNNNTIINDTAIGVFPPFVTDSFTFINSYTLQSGENNICVYSILPNDGEAINDTACMILSGLNTYTASYSDDFESINDWVTRENTFQWELGAPNSAFIDSAHSGQNAWVTKLSNNHKIGSIDYLYSPYIVIPTYADTAVLEFWMTMNVNSPSAYSQIEYSFDGILWLPIGYINDPSSTNWYNISINNLHYWSLYNHAWAKSSIQLNPSIFNTGNTFQIRFSFIGGSNAISFDGMAIDDFKITIPPEAIDVGIISIDTPSDTTTTGDIITVNVKLKNFGYNTITSIPLEYTINGTQIGNAVWTGSLAQDSVINYSFSTTYTALNSNYSICARTNLTGDLVGANDEYCKQIISIAGGKDAGVTQVLSPTGSTSIGEDITVKVVIKNFGTDTIFSTPIEYSINNITEATEIYSGSIKPNDSIAYIFTHKYNSLAGSYSICAKTNYSNDVDETNDESCVALIGTAIDYSNENAFIVSQNKPNPAKEITKIEFYIPKSGEVRFQLVNMVGAVIEYNNNTFAQGKNEIIIKSNEYPAGVYYYTVSFEGQRKTFKMVIVR